MYTFCYSNKSEFDWNFQGMLDEGRYKKSMQNIYKIGWKANYYNSNDV